MIKKSGDIGDPKQHSGKHPWLMILACLIPFLLLFGAVKYLGLGANYLWFGAILLFCIGMHVWMMKSKSGGGHQHG